MENAFETELERKRREQQMRRRVNYPPHPNERPGTVLPENGRSPFDDLFRSKQPNAFEDRK